jgi:cholesterol transport system auxiliary component
MKQYITLFLLLTFLFLPFNACLDLKQPSMKIAYYTLDYEHAPITGLNQLPHVLRVGRFSVAPLYNSTRIIYQDQSFKRDSYIYHRWRIHPGETITHLLTRDFRLSGLFKAVLSHDNRFLGTHLLEGGVDEFFEIDQEKRWEAVLSLSVVLMREKKEGPQVGSQNGNLIVFQKTYHSVTPCERKHPRALAEAMSRNMSIVSTEIISDVYQHLKVDDEKD